MTKKAKGKDRQLVGKELTVEVVNTVAELKGAKNHEKFFLLRMMGVDTPTASKLCGYKVKYGYDLNYKFKNSPIYKQRIAEIVDSMPDVYKATCKLQLAGIAEVERKALEEYNRDAKLAIDKPQLLKHMKQTAGVIGDDFQQATVTIPIDQIQVLIQQGMGSKNTNPAREGKLETIEINNK